VLGGTTIVISPLIALMVDQVKALNGKGVKAALISSGNGEKTNREIMEQLLGRRFTTKAKTVSMEPLEHITLLYVTPEQVQTTRFRDAMVELHKMKRLTLFAVDEAHWYVLYCCFICFWLLSINLKSHMVYCQSFLLGS
jgi:ATP-dependent DNA helicase RecQ